MTDKLTVEDVVSGLLDILEADYRMLARAQTPTERGVVIRAITDEIARRLEALDRIPEVIEMEAVRGVPWAGEEADDG